MAKIVNVDFGVSWMQFWDRFCGQLVEIGWPVRDAKAWTSRTLERTLRLCPSDGPTPKRIGRPRKDLTEARRKYDELKKKGMSRRKIIEAMGRADELHGGKLLGVSRQTIRRRLHTRRSE